MVEMTTFVIDYFPFYYCDAYIIWATALFPNYVSPQLWRDYSLTIYTKTRGDIDVHQKKCRRVHATLQGDCGRVYSFVHTRFHGHLVVSSAGTVTVSVIAHSRSALFITLSRYLSTKELVLNDWFIIHNRMGRTTKATSMKFRHYSFVLWCTADDRLKKDFPKSTF